MKIIFLGTPDFAVPTLKAIINSKHKVLAVVTQPDRPKGRDGKPTFSPVKEVAVENGIKVLQYEKIRLEGVEDLKSLNADIMVTCAFGQILSQEIIDITPKGIINVHGSLLPKYRGASPIQWSVINGEKETGITIMRTEKGVDTGNILFVKKTQIGDRETAGELFDRLSVIGSEMIVDALDKIESGDYTETVQNDAEATVCKMLKKEDGLIDFSDTAENIRNKIRGLNPWPCAYTGYKGKTLKIFTSSVMDVSGKVGEVVYVDKNGFAIGTGEKAIYIEELQLEGSKRMTAHDFLLGRKVSLGEKLC